jgi:hypothetical protein
LQPQNDFPLVIRLKESQTRNQVENFQMARQEILVEQQIYSSEESFDSDISEPRNSSSNIIKHTMNQQNREFKEIKGNALFDWKTLQEL